MEPRTVQKIQESLTALTQMHRQGALPGDAYYKCVVALAFEFSAAGEHLRAAGMVQGVPLEYFQQALRQQMEADPQFAACAYELALNLVQNGFVHLGPKVTPTMPAASA